MKYLLFLLFVIPQIVCAQKLNKSDKAIIENLKTEITFLSSDKLEGRRTGTSGEKLAYEYLSAQFGKTGLIPKGDNNNFIQAFEVNEGKEIIPATHLMINEKSLEINNDFFPFEFSANGSVKDYVSPAIKEKGAPWFWDINDLLEDHESNPHFDLEKAIRAKALESQKMASLTFLDFLAPNTYKYKPFAPFSFYTHFYYSNLYF